MKLLFFRKLIIGLICGLLSSAALLLIFTAILSNQDDPTSKLTLFSQISMIAGAIVTGKVATIGIQNRLLQGLFAGVFFASAILIPSAIMSSFTSYSAIRLLLTVVLAVAGAFLGKISLPKSTSNAKRKEIIRRYAR